MVGRLINCPRDTRGFSTLEMLIAMTLLVLTLSAVLLLIPTTQSGTIDTERGTDALEEASRALARERVRAKEDFRTVVASSTDTMRYGMSFHMERAVMPIDFFLYQATSRAGWGGWYGKNQQVELSTLLANLDQRDTCSASPSTSWQFPLASHFLFGALPGLADASGLYPLTDLDVYRNRLYATVQLSASTLPSVGPLGGGSVVDDARIGTSVWSLPKNALLSDNQYTSATLAAGDTTHYLRVSDFGFTVPRGATILGIEVAIERKSSSNTNTVKDDMVRIVHAGALGSTNKASATNWGTSDSYRTYGSSVDLWNETDWSPQVINDPAFGVVFAAAASGGSGARVASVDHVRITVTYTKQFYIVEVSGTPTVIGGLGQNSIAAGMNAVVVATSTSLGDYAYVAMNSSVAQLEVIDVSQPTAQVVSTYHVPGAAVAASTIFYHQGYVYLGLGNNPSGGELAIIDVHDTRAPVLVGTYEVGAGVNDIYLRTGILYLATDDSTRELLLLDVPDVAHPTLRASYNAPGTVGSGQGRSLYVVGDTVHLGRYYSLTTAPEYLSIDTSGIPLMESSYDVGPSASQPFGIYGVIARRNLVYLLTSSTAQGGTLSVFDATNPKNPIPQASLGLPHGGGGRALDCEGETLYAASVPATGSYANRGSLSVFTSL